MKTILCHHESVDVYIGQFIYLYTSFSKIQISLLFWYRLTRVVPNKGPLNGGVCVSHLQFPVDNYFGIIHNNTYSIKLKYF